MRTKVLTVVLLFCAGFSVAQQQTLYSNFVLNQYIYNPAYAGVYKGIEINANYRQQWAGFEDAPQTAIFSVYGTPKKKQNMAFGALIMNDKSGLIGRTSVYGSYSYHVKLGKKMSLGFGVSAGGISYNVKIYNAKPYDKDDDFLKSNILNANAFDANAGLYLYSKKFFLGFSGQQLPSSKIHWPNTMGRLTPHYYATIGYNITLDKKKKEWVLQPALLARFNSPAPYQIEANLRVIYKNAFWIGGNLRFGSSASGMFGCTISKMVTFAYSYDYALTSLQKYSNGSHELLLTVSIASKKKKSASDKVTDADEDEFNNLDNSIKTNLKNKKNDEEKK
ncbi:MAG: type IX secretion system membrane protein PorP/SprF [Bacteroidetes bacterium]|nr:type IX secretion system membrane protein PorP/SprF [Bacteroidota bacterium]